MYTLKRPLHKPIWVHHANALVSVAYRRLVRHHLFLCRQTTLPCSGKRASRPSVMLGRFLCPDRFLPGHKNLSPEPPGAGWHSVHGIAYANAIRCEGQHRDPQQPAYHACKPAGTELLGPWLSLQLSSSWHPALLVVAHPPSGIDPGRASLLANSSMHISWPPRFLQDMPPAEAATALEIFLVAF
jgi:hypothetical protein